MILFTGGRFQAINASGIVPGAQLFTYAAGTLTPLATYPTGASGTANTNPVICDASGQADVFLQPVAYRMILKTAQGVTIYDTDNVSLGTWAQLSTGAVTRTFEDRLRDSISVLDFMSAAQIADVRANTRSLDVAAAFQAAINAAVAGRLKLLVPSGSYRLSAKIVISTTAYGVCIEGDGAGVSKLVWDAGATGNGGLDITYSDIFLPPSVRGLSIQTLSTAAIGVGLRINGPVSASVISMGPLIDDVQVKGVDFTVHSWLMGISVFNAWYLSISNVSAQGKNADIPPFAMTAAIYLQDVNVCYMRGAAIFHAQNAILVSGSGATGGEALHLSDFELVGVDTGISLQSATVNASCHIHDGHINAYTYGINALGRLQSDFHNLLIYKTNLSVSDFVGVNLNNSGSNRVHDLQVEGSQSATGNTSGVVLTGTTGADNNHIHDCRFTNFAGGTRVGITVGTGAGGNRIHDNSADTTVTGGLIVVNSGAEKNNVIANNFPMVEQALPTGATPSIGNGTGSPFLTANTGATSLTNLVDGYLGQTVEILINEAFTTITDTASLNLAGNASLTGSGSVMVLRQYGAGVWRELSRRAP